MILEILARVKLEVDIDIEKIQEDNNVNLKDVLRSGLRNADHIDIALIDGESREILHEETDIPLNVDMEIRQIIAEIVSEKYKTLEQMLHESMGL